jgi:hypothetical protein
VGDALSVGCVSLDSPFEGGRVEAARRSLGFV